MKCGPLGFLLWSYFWYVYKQRPGISRIFKIQAAVLGPEIQGQWISYLKTFIMSTFNTRIGSTLQMKVPVSHQESCLPVGVPNLVVIMYNEIVLWVFCFLKRIFFFYHYRGMSLVLKLSKIKMWKITRLKRQLFSMVQNTVYTLNTAFPKQTGRTGNNTWLERHASAYQQAWFQRLWYFWV